MNLPLPFIRYGFFSIHHYTLDLNSHRNIRTFLFSKNTYIPKMLHCTKMSNSNKYELSIIA